MTFAERDQRPCNASLRMAPSALERHVEPAYLQEALATITQTKLFDIDLSRQAPRR
jgi:hypothetical protein